VCHLQILVHRRPAEHYAVARGGLAAAGCFLIRLCDLVRASSGRNGLICCLPGRGGGVSGGDHPPSGVVRGGPRVTRRPVLAVRAYVSPGPPWRTYVLVGRRPAVPVVPYFGDVLGDYPPPGPATWFDAGTAGRPSFLATLLTLKQSWQEDTDQKFASAASRQVGACVPGIRSLYGASVLRPRVNFEADKAPF
jgi:hypothetical protein